MHHNLQTPRIRSVAGPVRQSSYQYKILYLFIFIFMSYLLLRSCGVFTCRFYNQRFVDICLLIACYTSAPTITAEHDVACTLHCPLTLYRNCLLNTTFCLVLFLVAIKGEISWFFFYLGSWSGWEREWILCYIRNIYYYITYLTFSLNWNTILLNNSKVWVTIYTYIYITNICWC